MAVWLEMSHYLYRTHTTLRDRLTYENDQSLLWMEEYKFTEDEYESEGDGIWD